MEPQNQNKKETATTASQVHASKPMIPKKEDNVNLSFNAETIISQAIAQNVPVETLERILAMRRELKAEYAQEAFYKALAAFQAECPVIKKTKVVKSKDGTVRYKYAPLESIVAQVAPLLQKHGFSHTETTVGGKVIVKVIHELGHSDTSDFEVPINNDAYMNEAQKAASALTFAKRYAFCNAFGILTGDEDDDSLGTNHTAPVPAEKSPTPVKCNPSHAPTTPKLGSTALKYKEQIDKAINEGDLKLISSKIKTEHTVFHKISDNEALELFKVFQAKTKELEKKEKV